MVQDQGFAPGIEIEFSVFPSGPPAIEAMVGGSVDTNTAGSVPPLTAMFKKVALFREVSICGDASGLFQIVGTSDVSPLADPEGTWIAVTSGSNSDFFLGMALTNESLSDRAAGDLAQADCDALPDAALLVEGSQMPLERRRRSWTSSCAPKTAMMPWKRPLSKWFVPARASP